MQSSDNGGHGISDCDNVVVDDDEDTLMEPKLTEQVLGNLVLKIMNKMGLVIKKCVGIGTDGCSVLSSEICGAVATMQREVPQAIRCPCNNHSLNLSLARTSSVQSIHNAVGTVEQVISFFNASAKRNYVLKRVGGKQLRACVEMRWIERHDWVL